MLELTTEQAVEIVHAYIGGWVFYEGIPIAVLLPQLTQMLQLDQRRIEEERTISEIFKFRPFQTLPALV